MRSRMQVDQPGRQYVLKLPDASRRHFADAEALAVENPFLEDLCQPFVQPHGQLWPDRAVRELMKRLVLQCAPKLVAPLAFRERGESLAGDEHAGGVGEAIVG